MKHSPTKLFGAWLTNLQDHIFRDWSASKTERNRRALNQAIIRAENELCQARMRVIAIPRQTETTQVLLDKFLSYEAIQQAFGETNKGSLLAQLQAKRDALINKKAQIKRMKMVLKHSRNLPTSTRRCSRV